MKAHPGTSRRRRSVVTRVGHPNLKPISDQATATGARKMIDTSEDETSTKRNSKMRFPPENQAVCSNSNNLDIIRIHYFIIIIFLKY